MANLVVEIKNGETFVLPKEWIVEALPESILADAIINEPTVTYLYLAQPEVTPAVMQLLVDLSRGIEPTATITGTLADQIRSADRYLNVPLLLAYLHPEYSEFRRKGNRQDWYILWRTVISDDVPFYRYLLKKGARAANEHMTTAVQMNAPQIVRFLLANSSIDPSFDENSSLKYAVELGRLEIVRMLLNDPRVDPTSDDSLVLYYAVRQHNTPMLQLLLQDGRADPTAPYPKPTQSPQGPTFPFSAQVSMPEEEAEKYAAFNEAARKGYVDMVALFLADPRVDPSFNDSQVLVTAAEANQPDIVALLLADGRVDPSAGSNAALYAGMVGNRPDIIQAVLADPRVNPNDGDTLITAIHDNNLEAVQLLLAHPRIDLPAATVIPFLGTTIREPILNAALERGNVDIINAVLAHPLLRSRISPDELQAIRIRLGADLY